MKPCSVIFDRPYNTFFAGQTVQGRIEFVLKKSKKIRGILLVVKGESNVSWKSNEPTTSTSVEGEHSKKLAVTFSGKQEYFRLEQYCFGNEENEDLILGSGKHVYPFKFILPTNIPSSYEGQYGYVRYTIKVILKKHYYGDETKMAFTVISPFDLNLQPNIKEINQISNEKDLKMAWWSIGPIYYSLKTDKSGFVPGEDIPVNVIVDNNTNTDVTGITLKLQQTVTYTSQTPTLNTKIEEFTLEKVKIGSLAGQKSDSWTPLVKIPPCPPSGLNACPLIGIEYNLVLAIVINYKMFKTLKLVLPIKIGTEPLNVQPPVSNRQERPESPPITKQSFMVQVNLINPMILNIMAILTLLLANIPALNPYKIRRY
ncbi:arrestin domain containing protein [Holotrichia oblita]|uniref:Arrestin domain containing protein n=1 Tax=Holotrichia oblita TaxID=644536 RepID=A0ACB9SHQ3_HOLOL|nr:arrestin domain containing protein [Holotrichia oblita]